MKAKLFSFSLLLLALTACGQTALPVDAPIVEHPLSHGDTCAGLFDAYAIREKECVGTAIPDALRADLVAHCTAREALPGVSVAPGAFRDCAAKISTSSCASLPLECLSPATEAAEATLTWLGGSVAPFYYEIFPRAPGTLAAGTSCSLGAQCQSGACTSSETCGFCVDLKSVGEACGPTSECRGSQCQFGVCVEVGVAEGGACQDAKGDSDCLSTTYCKDSVCVPRLKVGDTCPDDYRPICPVGSICSGSVCQVVHDVKEGEACDSALARCSGELLQCVDGICRRPVDDVPVGGSCWLDTCAVGLHCAEEICVTPAPAGAACTVSAACMNGLKCLDAASETGHCGAPLLEGADCQSIDDCAAGLFCEFSKGPSGTCHSLGGSPGECGETDPCGGTEVCRWGMCGPLDICSAP